MKRTSTLLTLLAPLMFTGCPEDGGIIRFGDDDNTTFVGDDDDITMGDDDDTTQSLEYLGCTDLADYPYCYADENDELNAYIIIGASSESIDSLAASDILNGLMYEGIYGNHMTRLDSKVEDYRAQNSIVVGSADDNTITVALREDSEPAWGEGQGGIEIFLLPGISLTGNEAYTALLVDGDTPDETRLAAQVLAHHGDNLSGDCVVVEGEDWTTADVYSCDSTD